MHFSIISYCSTYFKLVSVLYSLSLTRWVFTEIFSNRCRCKIYLVVLPRFT